MNRKINTINHLMFAKTCLNLTKRPQYPSCFELLHDDMSCDRTYHFTTMMREAATSQNVSV